jgi:hypothetical protein
MEAKIIKNLDTLETHDRWEQYCQSQSVNVFQGAEECLKQNQMSLIFQDYSPYIYIFAHPRTTDDGSGKRLLWQPRLTRPTPQTNSYLFRAKSKTDEIEICWIIPPRELWPEYDDGKITESEIIRWSIDMFVNHREKLEMNHPEDLSDGEIKYIYKQVDKHFQMKKLGKKLILPDFMPSF